MKIIIFYGGYLPGEKYGGPVTSIYNFTELMGDLNQIFIICKNHDLGEKTPYANIVSGWNKVGKAMVCYLSDNEYRQKIFSKIIDEIEPDLIYASSFFSVKQTYPLLMIKKHSKVPMLLAPRGELNHNALALNGFKKKVYIFFIRISGLLSKTQFQATSKEEESNIIKTLNVNGERVFLLPNIPAVPIKKHIIHKKQRCLKLCFVGRIVKNKNLLVVLKSLLNTIGEIEFGIVGPHEDEEYWKQCEETISILPSNVKIKYHGTISHSKMSAIYSYYDCLISPTCFENYGQAIVEAMLHDVPVIISKGTTPWDDIADNGAGYTVPIDDIDGFKDIINKIVLMNNMQFTELVNRLRKYCIKKFDYASLKQQYTDAFNMIVEGENGTIL